MLTFRELSDREMMTRRDGMVPITEADRDEFAVALLLQGYSLARAHRMAFDEIDDNDGALQMLARHRIAHTPASLERRTQ